MKTKIKSFLAVLLVVGMGYTMDTMTTVLQGMILGKSINGNYTYMGGPAYVVLNGIMDTVGSSGWGWVIQYTHNGLWTTSVTPNKKGFRFNPKDTSFTNLGRVTKMNINFTAFDTMCPVIDVKWGNKIINLQDTLNTSISDNSGAMYKIRYYLSTDSGFSYALICTTLAKSTLDSTAFPSMISVPQYWKKLPYKPSTLGNKFRFKVEAFDLENNMGTGYSPIFSVLDTTKPTVNVQAPLAGANLIGGQSCHIMWAATDNISVVSRDIAITYDGTSWVKLDSAAGNSGSAYCVIPNIPTKIGKIRVRAYDQSNNIGVGYSGILTVIDSILTDTTAPKVTIVSPTTVEMGATYNITWTATDDKRVVKREIYFLKQDGAGYQFLDSSRTNVSGTWAWKVPAVRTTQARIKVCAYDTLNKMGYAITEPFSTTDTTCPTLTVTYPTAGVVLKGYSAAQIKFVGQDNYGIKKLSIYYSTDSWVTRVTIMENVNWDNLGAKAWTNGVPNISAPNCQIMMTIVDSMENSAQAFSPIFSITPMTGIVMENSLPKEFGALVMGNGLKIMMEKDGYVTLKLFSLKGQIVYSKSMTLKAGYHTEAVKMPAGVHVWSVRADGKQLTMRVVSK